MISKETKERIAKEAAEARTKYVKEETDFGTKASAVQYMGIAFKEAYIAGTEAWATRAEVLKKALEKVQRCCNSGAGGGAMDYVLQDILSVATDSLNQYNQPVK